MLVRGTQQKDQHFLEISFITRKPGSGQNRVTTQQDDRFWGLLRMRAKTASAVSLQNQPEEVRNVNANRKTVRRGLRTFELVACNVDEWSQVFRHNHGLSFTQNHICCNDDY